VVQPRYNRALRRSDRKSSQQKRVCGNESKNVFWNCFDGRFWVLLALPVLLSVLQVVACQDRFGCGLHYTLASWNSLHFSWTTRFRQEEHWQSQAMTEHIEWNDRYRDGDLPWDTGLPSSELQRVVNRNTIRPCRALELGCGTGTNCVWLAQQGFEVTGIDVAPLAVETPMRHPPIRAKSRARNNMGNSKRSPIMIR
jgi:hypothetical protein